MESLMTLVSVNTDKRLVSPVPYPITPLHPKTKVRGRVRVRVRFNLIY